MKHTVSTFILIVMLAFVVQANENRGLQIITIPDQSGQNVELYASSHALLIGVSEYSEGWPNLPGVSTDLHALQQQLETSGFQVNVVKNPDYMQLDQAIREFINQYGEHVENRLLFYFAGHGHTEQLATGVEMGYIVPADAPNPHRDASGFRAKAMDMQMFESYAKRIQAKHALFLFDSCFSGSIFDLSRAAPENITYKTAQPVRQFITSGSAGEQVPDTSIFRQQFVAALNGEGDITGDGYVTGAELGEFLQTTVVNYSKGTQHPQYGKIRDPRLDKGDFVFVLPGAVYVEKVHIDADTTQAIEPETAMWKLIEQSENIQDVKDFLAAFPDGKFVRVAQLKLNQLEREQPQDKQLEGGTEESQKVEAKTARKAGNVWTEPLINMEFVWIPGGCFQMGQTEQEKQQLLSEVDDEYYQKWFSKELPQHRVCVDGFWMGKYEVTQAQWQFIMGSNPSSNNRGDNHPVEEVSWNTVQEFIRKLNPRSGKTFRLPTEAEWEYACRAGTQTTYYFGNDSGRLGDYAWYRDNTNETQPVGQRKPNSWGLYDMLGNAWEWTEDNYREDAYQTHQLNNPLVVSGDSRRMYRGGGWDYSVSFVRCAYRDFGAPSFRHQLLGFRLVGTP